MILIDAYVFSLMFNDFQLIVNNPPTPLAVERVETTKVA